MGLDWSPGNKPKPGCAAEFVRLFHALQDSSTWWRKRKKGASAGLAGRSQRDALCATDHIR